MPLAIEKRCFLSPVGKSPNYSDKRKRGLDALLYRCAYLHPRDADIDTPIQWGIYSSFLILSGVWRCLLSLKKRKVPHFSYALYFKSSDGNKTTKPNYLLYYFYAPKDFLVMFAYFVSNPIRIIFDSQLCTCRYDYFSDTRMCSGCACCHIYDTLRIQSDKICQSSIQKEPAIIINSPTHFISINKCV